MFFTSALQIAAPLIVVLFLADLALALLTRVAPPLNVFAMSFPVKILLTLSLAAVAVGLLPGAVSTIMDRIVESFGAAAHRSGGVSRWPRTSREKTEKPTAQRRKEAAQGGAGRPRSADVAAWLTVLSFSFLAPMTVDRLRGTFETLMTPAAGGDRPPEPGSAAPGARDGRGRCRRRRWRRCCWPPRGWPSPAAPRRAG